MSRNPEKVSEVLAHVESLLSLGKPDHAIELIRHFGVDTPRLRDIYGVALLRAGKYSKAVDVFRSLCLNESGFCLRPNVPMSSKTNYATALLLDRNVLGCISLLNEIHDEKNPSVIRLRAAIRAWKKSLSLWERISFLIFGGVPNRAIEIDFVPGDTNNGDTKLRPAA